MTCSETIISRTERKRQAFAGRSVSRVRFIFVVEDVIAAGDHAPETLVDGGVENPAGPGNPARWKEYRNKAEKKLFSGDKYPSGGSRRAMPPPWSTSFAVDQ